MAEKPTPTSDELIQQLEELMANGGLASERRPIGVPVGYTAMPSGGGTQPLPPSFFDGDEYVPSTWATEDIGRLQEALRNAGVIGPRQRLPWGVWDERSRAAYRKVLEYANGAGLNDPLEALRRFAAARASGDFDDEERAPLVLRLPNPDELRRGFDAVFSTEIGRKLTSSELESMVAAFNAQQTAAQRHAYEQAETGGTVVEPPSVEAFAETQARRVDPRGAAEMEGLDAAGEFFQLLSSNGMGP